MALRVGIAFFWHKLGEAGGTQIYRRELLRALAACAPEHRYVLLNWEGEPAPLDPLPGNCEVASFRPSSMALGARLRRGLNQYLWRRLSNDLARDIDHLDLNVVHFPAAPIFPPGVKTPAVLSFFDMQHEFLPKNFTLVTRLKRWRTYRASVDQAERVISPSNHTTTTLVERYHVSLSKIVTVPIGVGEHYRPVNNAAVLAEIRAKHGLPEQFLLYPANNWPHKNHFRLFQAIARLNRAGGPWPRLVCTGARLEGMAPLSQLAGEAGLDQRHWLDLGYVMLEEMPALYSAATAVVFPSLFEGFGIPVVEAMACGCPVICSSSTALGEVAGEAACFINAHDPVHLAEGIAAVCRDLALQSKLRQQGIVRAEQYRWRRIIPRVVDVYTAANSR
jgi:glycosyltransferase involved in cell wall biosynthesis